jgi:hypothetical protein
MASLPSSYRIVNRFFSSCSCVAIRVGSLRHDRIGHADDGCLQVGVGGRELGSKVLLLSETSTLVISGVSSLGGSDHENGGRTLPGDTDTPSEEHLPSSMRTTRRQRRQRQMRIMYWCTIEIR